MFNRKKKLRKIEQEKQKLLQEKQELLRLKEILENNSPKVNIKDLYIFSVDDINYIVKLEVTKITGKNGYNMTLSGYESKVIDIFTNKTIYIKSSIDLIKRKELINKDIKNNFYYKDNYAYLKPIIEENKELLAYPNMLVPEYVLINLYHRINNINSDIFLKTKKKEGI